MVVMVMVVMIMVVMVMVVMHTTCIMVRLLSGTLVQLS